MKTPKQPDDSNLLLNLVILIVSVLAVMFIMSLQHNPDSGYNPINQMTPSKTIK